MWPLEQVSHYKISIVSLVLKTIDFVQSYKHPSISSTFQVLGEKTMSTTTISTPTNRPPTTTPPQQPTTAIANNNNNIYNYITL